MNRVFLYGVHGYSRWRREVTDFWNRLIGFTWIGRSGCKQYGMAPQFEVIELEELHMLGIPHPVLIAGPKANLHQIRFLPKDTILILSSASRHQLEAAAKFRLSVITLGLSSKDTLTFSSKDEESSVISLQRSFRTLSGAVAEPMEIPCLHDPDSDDFAILAGIAVLLLFDYFEEHSTADTLSFFRRRNTE